MLMLVFHYSHKRIRLLTKVYSTVECPHIYLLLRFYTLHNHLLLSFHSLLLSSVFLFICVHILGIHSCRISLAA